MKNLPGDMGAQREGASSGQLNLGDLGLRTHLFILAALVVVFSATSAMIYRFRADTDKVVEASFHQDLRLLMLLPRMRANMRQEDLLTEFASKSSDPQWLARRARMIERVDDLSEKMNEGSNSAEISSLLRDFQKHWKIFIEDQELALPQKVSHNGRPAAAQNLTVAADLRSDLAEILTAMSYAAAAEIEKSKELLESSSLHRFFARTAVELLGALLIAFYLYIFIVTPVVDLEKAAREWTIGRPWALKTSHAIPEIRSLVASFSENTKKLNAQFNREKELNEFKTKLVTLVSHEFGNALAVIKNAAFLLEDRASAAEIKNNESFYRMIQSNADSLSDAVNNLMSMSRLEAGKLAVNFAEVRAEEILRRTIERLKLLADAKHLAIDLELPQSLEAVRADAATLSLVVSNLLSNAIKYTPANGRIAVGLTPEPGQPDFIRLYVKDTGIGIAPEDRTKILQGYFRAESGKRVTLRGFGIGLSLARQIIEAHGSALDLESSPGKGSRFSFLLPLWPRRIDL
jgi:signal transduction histidine kinase